MRLRRETNVDKVQFTVGEEVWVCWPTGRVSREILRKAGPTTFKVASYGRVKEKLLRRNIFKTECDALLAAEPILEKHLLGYIRAIGDLRHRIRDCEAYGGELKQKRLAI